MMECKKFIIMSLTYYYFPLSQSSRAILAFLKLTGIPYQRVVVNIFKKENKSSEYLKIAPNGDVPAIEDLGLTLSEPEAIIRYLLHKSRVAETYYPAVPKTRALIDQFFAFHHDTFQPFLVLYFTSSLPGFFGKVKEPMESIKSSVEEACKMFEEVYIQGKKYIGGESLTIADLFAVNDLTTIYFATNFDFNKFPSIKAYIERCLENPAIRDVNKPIESLRESLKMLSS